ncbi:PHD finger family protein / bromo-adjacenthomology (BAH) domain-containing protein, partial [Striga asiatica]
EQTPARGKATGFTEQATFFALKGLLKLHGMKHKKPHRLKELTRGRNEIMTHDRISEITGAPIKYRTVTFVNVILLIAKGKGTSSEVRFSDGLTKEVCLGLHYPVKRIRELGRKSGWFFVALYLKQASTCLMQYYSTTGKYKPDSLSVSISLTRSGLSRIIPPYHR